MRSILVLLMRSILVLLVRSILLLFFTSKRKQSGFVGYRRPINLEPGFNRVSRIHHVGVIQPHAAGNSPPVLISRGKRFSFVLGIGQHVIGIGRKRRPAVPEVAGHAEKLIRIHVVPPHQMGVLVMFLLVFINGFRRLRHKLWVGVVPDQFFNLFVRRQTRLRGNLIVRHAVQEQPRDVVAVVELVVPTQEGLVSLAVAVKDGLPQRRRINPPIGLQVIIHHVKPEPIPHGPAVFKRRHHRFIRPAEGLEGPKARLRSAFAGDVDHRGGPIPVLRLHAAENDVRSLPDSRMKQVRKLRRDGVRNGHAVDPQLDVRMVLSNVDLSETAVDGTRNGE